MKRLSVILIFFLLLWIAILAPQITFQTTPKNEITKAKFDRLHEGMTYNQCVEILGRAGAPFGTSAAPGLPMEDSEWTSYRWSNSTSSYLEASFQHGRLFKKHAEGLK